MKGITVIGLIDNETYCLCRKCWEQGGRLLYERAIIDLSKKGLPSSFKLREGTITYCNVCNKEQKDLN